METRQEALRLHEAMAADHARLECLFRDVLSAMTSGDRDAVRSRWLVLEAALTSHIDFEERCLMPRFEVGFPYEAAHIRQEHRLIREAVAQLGIDLDLHALRPESAEHFIARLRKHAAREDTLFYVWAEAHVPDDDRLSFIERFREWFARERSTHPPVSETPTRRPPPKEREGDELAC